MLEVFEDEVSRDCGGELGAVEDVAVGLAEALHGLGLVAGDGGGEVGPEGGGFGEGDRRDGDDGWGGGDGGEAGLGGLMGIISFGFCGGVGEIQGSLHCGGKVRRLRSR